MRNIANATTPESLDAIVARMNESRHDYAYHAYIGLEVEGLLHRAGERHTLAPAYNAIGFAGELLGATVECSALGLGSQWRVVAVASGEPGRMRVVRFP